MPDLVSFYRWHIPDPIVFNEEIRVTIQQMGVVFFDEGQESEFEAYKETNPAADEGWFFDPRPGRHVQGLAERQDDYCATGYVYCRNPQPVPRLNLEAAPVDIEQLSYEHFEGTGLMA